MSVALCTPCKDYTNVGYTKCLVDLTSRLTRKGIEHEVLFSVGSVLPQLRQNLAEESVNNNYDWILWLDSDMHFPDHVFESLAKHQESVVACTYSTRYNPQRNVAFTNRENTDERINKINGLKKVFAVGMGCMLVNTSVFDEIPKPWFQHQWNEEEEIYSGEDVYFCDLLNQYNYSVFVDTDLSEEIAHYGTKAFFLSETQEFS